MYIRETGCNYPITEIINLFGFTHPVPSRFLGADRSNFIAVKSHKSVQNIFR